MGIGSERPAGSIVRLAVPTRCLSPFLPVLANCLLPTASYLPPTPPVDNRPSPEKIIPSAVPNSSFILPPSAFKKPAPIV